MRKSFDIRETELELRKNLEHTFSVVLCAEPFWDGLGVGISAADKSDGSGCKHYILLLG
jgi:hypothetical protein